MNILTKVTWRSMLQNRTRTIVTVIGIILSAAMFTAVVTLGISLRSFLIRGQILNQGDYFIQCDYLTDEDLSALRKYPDVTSVADLQVLGALCFEEGAGGLLAAAGDQAFYDTMPAYLVEGRLPRNSQEILLPKGTVRQMENYGLETRIGKTLTLRLETFLELRDPELLPDQTDAPFTATYTIVGYVDGNMYGDYELATDHMLTYADGGQGSALWHRAFVKTPPGKIMSVYNDEDLGKVKSLHTTLCGLYGVTEFANINGMLLALVSVLCAIIMVGSVSLIYNAFSISVSERTKQFGLLASIGATRKQMRRGVYTEAMTLCALGIPLGVLAGYGGIWVTLKLLSPRIDRMLSMADGAVTLRAEFSLWGLAAAAVIALVTVLTSAAIPAARATKISPMEAIRQHRDYRRPKKARKLGKLTLRLFGLPGALGKAYYSVSRGKYRTTVISLFISFVLFVSASCFSQTMRSNVASTVMAQSFDISVRADHQALEQLREQAFVEKAAYERQAYYSAFTPDDQLSDDFLKYWDKLQQYYPQSGKNVTEIRIFYLEDAVLKAYLEDQGIDPEPYFDPDCPSALVCQKNFAIYGYDRGESTRYVYQYHHFSETADRLHLFSQGIPDELQPPHAQYLGPYSYELSPEGELLLVTTWFSDAPEPFEEQVSYRLVLEDTAPGKTAVSYYPYDVAAQAPVITKTHDVPVFRLGAFIADLPYGIPTGASEQYFYTSLILPLSQAPADEELDTILHLSVSDYPAAVEYLDRYFETQEYQDIRSSEEYNRTVLLVLNVFSYGFILLISLISIANVFNTISTNVSLRRRDFGILRSIGFREKDLMKMMQFECINYGFRALAWSIPLSLPLSYLIWSISKSTYTASYEPPWLALLIGTLSIFAVVFAAMFYSVSKIKKDNPIEAIRMESL